MQEDSPDDELLVRETIASLGPGAKNFTRDHLTAWIRQLEELCNSHDVALASALFRTDINGSCRSKFLEDGKMSMTTAQTTMLQTKAVKGYPPLPELHLEKVSSNKKNARGEAKLRLHVDSGPVLVMLTITDLDGATHSLRAIMEDDNNLIPIRYLGAPIEVTAIPFAPDELLERLLQVEAKNKLQREQHGQPSASAGEKASMDVKKTSPQRQEDGVKCMTKRVDGQILEYTFDPDKGTVTMKSSRCANPNCDDENCPCAPITLTFNVKTHEIDAICCHHVNAIIAPILKSFQENPRRQLDLAKRVATIFKEERAIEEKLSTAKPGEAKRLIKELERKEAEYAKLKRLMFRPAETGGWLGVSEDELFALLEKADQKDPQSVRLLGIQAFAALDDYYKIIEKLESTSSETNKKRLCKLLRHKEIVFDEVMNEVAVIADGSEVEDSSEQKETKEQNDFSIRLACRALAAFDECNTIKEELESTSSETIKKRLCKLLGHHEVDMDDVLNYVCCLHCGTDGNDDEVLVEP